MKDLFKKYHRHKVLTNLWILSISAVLAVSVNMFLLWGPTWETLKANVLEATEKSVNQDFIAYIDWWSIHFRNNSTMRQVKDFSFSLAYNPEVLELDTTKSVLNGSEVHTIENEDGFVNYIVTLTVAGDIASNTTLLSIPYTKTVQSTAQLNIINVNFSDSSWNIYSLSTRGIMF